MPNLTSEAVRTYTIRDFAGDVAQCIKDEEDPYWDLIKLGKVPTGWTFLGQGWSRITLSRGKKHVLKLPRCGEGNQCNQQESDAYAADHRHLARCRVLKLSGLTCLVMEKLDTADAYHRATLNGYPAWAVGMDGLQGGFNRHGEFVAYDFSSDLLPVR